MRQVSTLRPYLGTLISFMLILMLALPVIGQEDGEKKKKEKARHRISYMNQADTLKYLESYLYFSKKGDKTEIEGATIEFYALSDTGEVLIGEALTNASGRARGVLPGNMDLPHDTSGLYTFEARFDGNSEYKGRDTEIQIKDLKIKVEFEEEDSSRLITFMAIDPKSGDKIEDIEVGFYVERLFLPLLIGTETTNRKGIAELEFPTDLPGDKNGNLNILVKVDDNELYGNYMSSNSLQWGIPVESIDHSSDRELWSPYAPLWMVLTFILLMLAAWGHYAAIIAMLYNIHKDPHGNGTEIEWNS